MNDPGSESTSPPRSIASRVGDVLAFIGTLLLTLLEHIGEAILLLGGAGRWVVRSFTRPKVRIGKAAIVSQIIRIGVRSVLIVSIVSGCVGLILALQLTPPLDERGGKEYVANIIGVAVLRELGPLIGAIVLTGFAGASIAAEIGTMVVGEEIEALEAHALNPVKFLVVPRLIASTLSMGVLAVLANIASIAAAMGISVLALEIPYGTFWGNLLDQVKPVDFLTGVGKALVFGMLIGLIACQNGLKVSGGAAGVGKATTSTVVQCIVAIILSDLVFTAVFYALKFY